MNERITLVSLLDKENLAKTYQLINPIQEPLCKVSFGKNVADRIKNDTLPYHFTLFSWNITKEKEILQFLETIKFTPLKILIDKIDIMSGNEDSYILYFNIAYSNELKELQTQIYNSYPYKYYTPNHFNFHITIHIDKDKKKIQQIKKEIETNFSPLELEIRNLGLFEIYPAKLIAKY